MGLRFDCCSATDFWDIWNTHPTLCCTEDQQKKILDAYQAMLDRVGNRLSGAAPGLADCLAEILDSDELSVCVKCKTPSGVSGGGELGGRAFKSKGIVEFYEPYISDHGEDPIADQRLEQIILHEAIHLCGGTELDAYAVTNWLYGFSFSPISRSVLDDQYEETAIPGRIGPDGIRSGVFVLWDPETGDVWIRDPRNTGFFFEKGQQILFKREEYRYNEGGKDDGCC